MEIKGGHQITEKEIKGKKAILVQSQARLVGKEKETGLVGAPFILSKEIRDGSLLINERTTAPSAHPIPHLRVGEPSAQLLQE